MPPLETRRLHQKALLWVWLRDDEYARPVVDEVIEIEVRWEFRQEKMVTTDGRVVSVDAIVVVDRDIPMGSVMWLGEMVDWVGTGTGTQDNELMQVVIKGNIPDLKNRHNRRTVGLIRFRNTPAILG